MLLGDQSSSVIAIYKKIRGKLRNGKRKRKGGLTHVKSEQTAPIWKRQSNLPCQGIQASIKGGLKRGGLGGVTKRPVCCQGNRARQMLIHASEACPNAKS